MHLLLPFCLLAAVAPPDDRPRVVVVAGAPGTPEYSAEFRRWAGLWTAAAAKGSAEVVPIGLDAPSAAGDRDRLRAAIAETPAEGSSPLWIVLIGHGTFDGREAKFNLRGPDVTDVELAQWLAPLKRPVAVIDCTSSSGTFLGRLSGPNRVVVTATRSGAEQNYARFGGYLAESIADPKADLDKDGQVSLLEAYLAASARVAEYYKTKSQLATEHSLIDDNGDKLGTPPDWFRGVRAARRAKDGASPDGARAHQLSLVPGARDLRLTPEARRRRDELELAISALRDKKAAMSEEDYYSKLDTLMVELARLYRGVPPEPESPGRP